VEQLIEIVYLDFLLDYQKGKNAFSHSVRVASALNGSINLNFRRHRRLRGSENMRTIVKETHLNKED